MNMKNLTPFYLIFFVFITTFNTPVHACSWFKEGCLLLDEEKKTQATVTIEKKPNESANNSPFKAGFLLPEKQQKKKQDSSDSSKRNEAASTSRHNTLFPKGFLLQETHSQSSPCVEKPEPIDPWSKAKPPTIHTSGEYMFYLAGQNKLPGKQLFEKLGGRFWVLNIWNEPSKAIKYILDAISPARPDDIKNNKTQMCSLKGFTELRDSLLYTVKVYMDNNPEKNPPVLEVGPGNGYMLQHLLVLGAKIKAVDFDESTLERAKEQLSSHEEYLPNDYRNLVSFERSDVKDPKSSFYKGKYWFINCELLFHFLTPDQMKGTLKGFSNCLYPGGLLFLSTTNIFRSNKAIREYLKGREEGKEFPREGAISTHEGVDLYMINIALKELTSLVRNSGFKIESSHNVTYDGQKTERDCFTTDPQKGVISCVIGRKPT